MPRWQGSIEPTYFSRFECKYVVDPMVVSEIRGFLRSFARPDAFAAARPDGRYPVCSLYLDSEDLRLYSQTVAGEKNRFKLRVRTYDDDPDSPAFCEVKSKNNAIVHKRRAVLSRAQAAALLRDAPPRWRDELDPDTASDVDVFTQSTGLVMARPIVRVKYMREAWESHGNEPVRVTIDTDLTHAVTMRGELRHGPGHWRRTPVGGPIVELKFTERFPAWVHDMVRMFGLKQQAVPKYVLSVDEMLMGGRASALAVAGLTLPPREL